MRSYHQKTWSNKYIPVQPFCQDLRVYWVWDTCQEEDAKRHIESVGVTSRGAGTWCWNPRTTDLKPSLFELMVISIYPETHAAEGGHSDVP